jgi:hypothetical protein
MPSTGAMSKSPRDVAVEALKAAERALPAFSATHSPKKFTQHQHFAIAVLRQFFKVDYRGIAGILEDAAELRDALGLQVVPHFSTIAYAEKRLQKGGFRPCVAGLGSERPTQESSR